MPIVLLPILAELAIASLLIYLLIFLIAISVIWWLVNQFLPEPLKKYAIAVIVVLGAILLISLLVSMTGGGTVHL